MTQTTTPIDPVSVVTAVAAVLLGPDVAALAGPYAAIAIASATGAAWALGRRAPTSPAGAALFMARLVLTALLISVSVEAGVNRWLGQTSGHWLLTPIALLVGGIGDDWPIVARWLLSRAARMVERRTDGGAK